MEMQQEAANRAPPSEVSPEVVLAAYWWPDVSSLHKTFSTLKILFLLLSGKGFGIIFYDLNRLNIERDW